LRIVMLGAPGVGKGTQAKKIMKVFGIPQISTGDLLREAVRNQTELGRKAKSYMDRGELVPDNVIIDIIRERLQQDDCKSGFILDGFPRTIPQAEALDRLLADMDQKLDAVIDISVDYDAVVQRLVNRRICSRCGADYNLLTNPPKVDGTCDACGGKIIRRDDDNEETIRRRFSVYEEQTQPLRDFYRKKSLLREIDGNRTVDEVFADIADILTEIDRAQ